jgi:hypothetical protein
MIFLSASSLLASLPLLQPLMDLIIDAVNGGKQMRVFRPRAAVADDVEIISFGHDGAAL